jgi:hypothetical protein
VIIPDGLRSYRVAMNDLDNREKQGGRSLSEQSDGEKPPGIPPMRAAMLRFRQ